MEKFSASLLGGRLVFGKYPDENEFQLILDNGYNLIIDLCTPEEIEWDNSYKDIYKDGLTQVNCPIVDGRSQKILNVSLFNKLVDHCIDLLRNYDSKIYIHCKGGHGRSAMMAAIIYGKFFYLNANDSILAIRNSHQLRTEMKAKWRKLGAPQRAQQKKIIQYYLY